MLLVVSPNLAVDRVLEVEGLQKGAVHRTCSVLVQAGGKGSNVARVFRQFGGDVAVIGFVGGRSGAWIVDQLRSLGISVDAVQGYSQESRTCTIIRDPTLSGPPTVINEESPEVEPGAAAELIARVQAWLPRVDAVLVTGSLSRGLPFTFYRRLLEHSAQQNKITALDAAGPALQEGLKAHPTFAKPNAEEFAALAGCGETALAGIARHVRSELNSFADQFAVTLGEQGAILVAGSQSWQARPPRIRHTNPIGCGDAFVAGYLHGLLNNLDFKASFRLAIAAAVSDAGSLAPGFIDREEVEELAQEVEVVRCSFQK
ncbi:MAG TPA: hexose kinase [Acidobacteriota bacterium]